MAVFKKALIPSGVWQLCQLPTASTKLDPSMDVENALRSNAKTVEDSLRYVL